MSNYKLDGVHLLDRKTKFYLKDVKLHQFDRSFSDNKEWISFKRDIRINSLLNDKKIQFDIENITIFGRIDDSSQFNNIMNGISFTVKSMSLIIKNDDIQEIEITWRPLTTSDGRVLIGLIEAGIHIDIEMKFIDNEFIYFYVDFPKNVA